MHCILLVLPAGPAARLCWGTCRRGGERGDSPHARGLAQAARPGQLAALPGTVLPVRLPRALALLLVLLLVIVELLDAVLVADLQ